MNRAGPIMPDKCSLIFNEIGQLQHTTSCELKEVGMSLRTVLIAMNDINNDHKSIQDNWLSMKELQNYLYFI